MYNKIIRSKKTLVILKFVSVLSFILGILSWVPNIVYHKPMGFWIYSIPLGIIGIICSIITKKYLLLVLNVLVAFSFFIFMMIGYTSNAISKHFYPQKKNMFINQIVTAPEGTIPLNEGEIYEKLSKETTDTQIIYFGRTNCTYCDEFNTSLNEALELKDQKYSIYYYNTEEMPFEEASEVLEQLDIDRVPYLVKIEKGIVVATQTVADKTQIINFLN
ncbi:thioredoxin family protein [Clostridium sp. E02]|uniref:thioredoxin family protein n=1 Tax=Clostridium sp. E02 TaxID=2487134 RepID=UPI000F53482E|nr:thioredoxin family protein [Clostridium sp. E02]